MTEAFIIAIIPWERVSGRGRSIAENITTRHAFYSHRLAVQVFLSNSSPPPEFIIAAKETISRSHNQIAPNSKIVNSNSSYSKRINLPDAKVVYTSEDLQSSKNKSCSANRSVEWYLQKGAKANNRSEKLDLRKESVCGKPIR